MMFQSVVCFSNVFPTPQKSKTSQGKKSRIPSLKINPTTKENPSFRGASPRGEVWGCRWQQGIVLLIWKWCVWVALGKRICWVRFVVFFFWDFFQSKCSKIQKGDFFWTFPLGRVEEIRNHAEGFLGAFGRFRRHCNHGSQALKRRSLRNH